MNDAMNATKHVSIGIGGTLASVGLGQLESVAAISAGFATAVYMLVKAWQATRKKD
jgi:hypothetical protein